MPYGWGTLYYDLVMQWRSARVFTSRSYAIIDIFSCDLRDEKFRTINTYRHMPSVLMFIASLSASMKLVCRRIMIMLENYVRNVFIVRNYKMTGWGESLNFCTTGKFRVDKSTEAYKQQVLRWRILGDTNNTSCATVCVCVCVCVTPAD